MTPPNPRLAPEIASIGYELDDDQSGITRIDAAPQVDGRYRVLGSLGAGMLVRAVDVFLGRQVAVRLVDPHKLRVPKDMQMAPASRPVLLPSIVPPRPNAALPAANTVTDVFRQARALARVRHENLARLHAFGVHEGVVFFATDLAEGEDLGSRLATQGRLALPRVLEIAGKVAKALDAIHAHELTHGDLSPRRVIVEEATERVVVTGAERRWSNGGSTRPRYPAPEMARRTVPQPTPRSDLYALACLTFELLVGRPLFDGATADEVEHLHAWEAPPLVSAFLPALAPLDPVFARAFAKDSRYRPASVVTFAEELAAAAEGACLVEDASSRASSSLPTSPSATPVARVLVLADADGPRRLVVREAERALGRLGRPVVTECFTEASELVAAFSRTSADLVILDDAQAAGTSIPIAAHLRRMSGGDRARVVILTRDMLADRSTWDSLDARRIGKPLRQDMLARVFGR